MEIKARLKYLRIAPRKVRLVADLIRGEKATEAQAILRYVNKRASLPLLKLLNSALASAKNDFQIEAKDLYVKKITVDEGPKLKRWRAQARGITHEIQRKSSHINIVLDELTRGKRKTKVSKKPKAVKKPKKPKEISEKIAEKKVKPKVPKAIPQKIAKKPTIEKKTKRMFRRKAF